jgi:outer membrane immunogenic protein
MMRRLVLLVLSTVSLTAAAQAADIPVKAPYPMKAPYFAPTPAYNWSGVYGGGNIGYIWIDQDVAWPGAAATPSFSHNRNTWIGGFHGGVQYQWNSIVLGVEAAWFDTFKPDETTGSPAAGCPTAANTCQAGLSAVWQIGGRLGWAYNDWLIYGTGGYANGKVRARQFVTATGAMLDDFDDRHGGWYAGVGVEYAFWKGGLADGIVGVEYQHIDLGTVREYSQLDGNAFGANTRDIRTTADLVRLRLSLKGNPLGALGY